MKTELFEIENRTAIMSEIKKVKNTVYTIDSLTINLKINLINDNKFINNLVIFYKDIKKSALENHIKLSTFKTDKEKYTAETKATGTLQNINNFLFLLNSGNIEIANKQTIN
jgi:hypothetical protein